MNEMDTWARLARTLGPDSARVKPAATPRHAAHRLANALPPMARYFAHGFLDDMTDGDVVRWARLFEAAALWVCSSQQQNTEVPQ